MNLLVNSTNNLEKNSHQFFFKLFQRIKEEVRPQNSFSEARMTQVLKPDTCLTGKENYRPIFLMNIDTKILNKILGKMN